jgi:hypothetical protein
MNLVAKPIIKGEYWVVTDGDKKVGNVIQEGSNYQVKLNNTVETYDSTKSIEKIKKIEFEKTKKVKTELKNPPFAVYPTESNRIYNSFYDVKRKLHIFTKGAKSKCYFVAGWFGVKQTDTFTKIFCPKYIFIQRYEYIGPFKSEEELNNSINIL